MRTFPRPLSTVCVWFSDREKEQGNLTSLAQATTRGQKRAFWGLCNILPRGVERKNEDEELVTPLLRALWCEAST